MSDENTTNINNSKPQNPDFSQAEKNRGQKLPKYLLHMNSSSFKHDPQ
jgi:hypothetical protein